MLITARGRPSSSGIPSCAKDFRYLERGWLKLARSLEFAELSEPPKRSSG
jgi:hypothetical protein